jgi:hypothetical protein
MRSEPIKPPLTRDQAWQAVERGWRTRQTCCRDAVIVQCVCRLSVRCPTHGSICVGSHD